MLYSLTHRHGQGNERAVALSIEGTTMTPKGPRRRSSGLRFFASSSIQDADPAATPPHKRWETDYIKDLRTNRPARPSGSRPVPDRASSSIADPFARATSALSFRPSLSTQQAAFAGEEKERSRSALSHRRAQSDMPTRGSNGLTLGTKAAFERRPTRDFSKSTQASKITVISPSNTYRESGMRWLEKQEARSLREALEDMDSREEARVHAAAQNEATEIVCKHRGEVQKRAPSRQRTYREHLQKGAHARSQSQAWNGALAEVRITDSSRVSDKSTLTSSDHSTPQDGCGIVGPSADPDIEEPKSHMEWDSPQKKSYMNLSFPFELRKTSGRRRSSGPRVRDVSGGPFRNSEDRIYEEPSEETKEVRVGDLNHNSKIPLVSKARNTVSRIQTASQPFLRSRQSSAEDKRPLGRSEIHKNAPSRSRDPLYTRNEIPVMLSKGGPDQMNGTSRETRVQKETIEIRSDEIRAATSMRMKDRSPKLPTPVAVSGRPGRPIVSFNHDWKPKKTENHEDIGATRPPGVPSRLRHKPPMLESTASAPLVPTINISESPQILVNSADDVFTQDSQSIPSISMSDTLVPSISSSDNSRSARPLPDPSSRLRPMPANRPLPHHFSTAPVQMSMPHWTAAQQRATVQCAACALPIAGRIVSAASQRFHSHCFTCHHCAEPLECVAFYPEPDSRREERLSRIEARANGQEVSEEKPGETATDDGDASLRFYCHLDFHEFFSPRCKSCKTPIESEVVVACGSTWHVGHFFCAECGDPFDPKTPFVERNGYAWCVNCHAGKFSGKCKGCKKPVVTEGTRALDADWHEGCFICSECSGPFEDGRFFTREADPQRPICVGCEERRLKA